MNGSCDCRPGRVLVVAAAILFLTAPGIRGEEPPPAAGRVSLEFRDADIIEILKLLATKAGLNLVAGRNVTGQITLFLHDVAVEDALEVVLVAGELAVERRGSILSVMPQRDYELVYGQPYRDRRVLRSMILQHAKVADVSRTLTQVKSNVGRVITDDATNTLILMDTPEVVQQMATLAEGMDRPLETRVFGLNYGAIKAFAPLLQEVVTRGVARISVDERTNKVAVTDYPQRLDEIARLAAAFDERSLEVLIEAKIVQVSLSDKFQMGVDWEALGRESLTIKGLGALNLASGGSIKVASPASRGKDYKVLIEALRAYGDTTILSEPRLTVVNNQEAKILVGVKEPYVTKTVSQTGTGTAVTAESVTFIDVGVKLFVTPTITRDGFVQMKVRPEVSSKTGTLTTSEKNEIPIVETTEAETTLLVQDGGTVILGGLIKDEKSIDHQRIPILGDIPLLGLFFRTSKDTIKKAELVVFLTPHIISGHRGELMASTGRPAAPQSGSDYYALVIEEVHRIAAAQTPLSKSGGTVIVEVTIASDGRIHGSPRIVSRTAPGLDRLARHAVLVAAPLPPFPSGIRKPRITVRIPITYKAS